MRCSSMISKEPQQASARAGRLLLNHKGPRQRIRRAVSKPKQAVVITTKRGLWNYSMKWTPLGVSIYRFAINSIENPAKKINNKSP